MDVSSGTGRSGAEELNGNFLINFDFGKILLFDFTLCFYMKLMVKQTLTSDST